jgi:hypothetical protein
MKQLLLLLFIFSAINSFAYVRFEKLTTENIKNQKIKTLITTWQNDFDIDDAGAYGIQVYQLSSSKNWVKTIKHIAYIQAYCLDSIVANPVKNSSSLYQLTEELIDNMAYLDEFNREEVVHNSTLKYVPMLEELHGEKGMMILEGYTSCDSFSAGHMEITIVDTLNKQYFVLYGGYSE